MPACRRQGIVTSFSQMGKRTPGVVAFKKIPAKIALTGIFLFSKIQLDYPSFQGALYSLFTKALASSRLVTRILSASQSIFIFLPG